MKHVFKFILILWTLALVGTLVSCGGDDEGTYAPAPASASIETTMGYGDNVASAVAMSPQPTPTPAPQPAMAPAPQPAVTPASQAAMAPPKVQAASPAQSRIIVHTARMSLVVEEVAVTLDRIGGIAHSFDGWVVSSDRTSRNNGSIAIRVPAQSLEEAFTELDALALKVEARSVTSQDVTDQYVDNQSRLSSLLATEERLLSFLDQADKVEDALAVQNELSNLQLQIEETRGRLNLLEQTAAYSLINVSLRVPPEAMDVEAGEDLSVKVGEAARFRASFMAPADIEDFTFVWNFGDGTTVSGSGSVPRPDGNWVTATVNHVYEDDLDSPYIVTVDLSGSGEGGIAEGSDSLEVTVSEVPTIEVFAGEDQTVEEGNKVEYSASFLRPAELWDFEYQWDFGDGSPTVTGNPEEGATRLESTHTYSDHRPASYMAVLKVSAMSDAGEVSGSDSFRVQVTESQSLLIGDWDVGETAKTAVRALSMVARTATMVIIWLAIFSPAIAAVAGVAYLANRAKGRFLPSRARSPKKGPEPKVDDGASE